MVLIIYFGRSGSGYRADWHRPVKDFPKVLSYNGTKWSWFMFNNGTDGVDYELHFSEVPSYKPEFNDKAIDFTRILFGLELEDQVCECGAEKLNHPGHSSWCPKF